MSADNPTPLQRATTWEEWERGRAARRAACDRISGGGELRRLSGDPRKDVLLRQLNRGERGLPFAEFAATRETNVIGERLSPEG